MNPDAPRKRILAACYGAAHVEMLLPLIEPLRRVHDVTVIGINTAAAQLRKNGIAFTGIGALSSQMGIDASVRYWGEMALASDTGSLSLSREESIAYLGMNLRDLCLQHGQEAALTIYRQQGRTAFHPVHFARQLVQQLAPDLVLTTSAPRLERALIEAASERAIPSLVLVDQYPHHELRWLTSPTFGTRLAVLDASVKDMIVAQGRTAQDIVVTGNPAFDRLATIRHLERATPARIVYLSQSAPYQPGEDVPPAPMSHRVLAALLDAAQRRGWTIIYRPHPNEREVSVHHPRLVTHRSGAVDLIESLAGAAVAVTETSTAGIQALLAGVPLVQLGCSRRARRPPFENFGATRIAASPEQIEEAVGHALDTPFQGAEAATQATQRVLRLIEDLLHPSPADERPVHTVPPQSGTAC